MIQAQDLGQTSSRPLLLNPYGGNVGIGTTGPGTSKLHVERPAADASGQLLYLRSYTDGADANILMYADNDAGTLKGGQFGFDPDLPALYFDDNGDNTKDMVIKAGNVGIGTTGPNQKLVVDVGAPASADKTIAAFSSEYGTRDIGLFWDDSLSTLGIGSITAHNFVIHTGGNSNPRVTVDTSGNVGIGTTGPGSRLEIENTASADDVLLLEDSSGLCEAQPSTTGLTWSCSSDVRLKTNVTNASSKLGYLLGLPLFDYNVIATGERATGPIAQETAKKYPGLVRPGDDGYLIVSEIPQPVIIKAIQELKSEKDSEIEQLKRENRQLRDDMALLKAEIQILKKSANGGK